MYEGHTFTGLLAHNAELYPNGIAVRLGQRTLTHAELDRASNRLAAGLISLGVNPGEKIAIGLPRLPETVMSFFAVNKAGAVIVPITMGLKAYELLPIFKEAEISCAIVSPKIYGALAPIRGQLPALRNVILLSYESYPDSHSFQDLLEKAPDKFHPAETREDELAAVYYTPGTQEGTRGAMQTQRGMLHSAQGLTQVLHLTHDDKALGILDLNQPYGISAVLLTSLVAGCEMVLIQRFVARQVLEAFSKYDITVFWGVPLAYMLICMETSGERYETPASLNYCVSGGAPLTTELARRFEEIFDLKLLQLYGLAEACTVAITPPGDIRDGSVGLPVPGTLIEAIDEKHEPLSTGRVGEIVISGPSVMLGYYKQEDSTAGTLHKGELHTGDMGRFDNDGHLYLVDRIKDIIIRSDYKIFPSELENGLKEHPKIAEAVVVGVKDVYMGEVPKAFVVLKPGEQANRDEIMNWCKENFADYSVPKYIRIVDKIPRDRAGRVMREKLTGSEI